MKILLFITTLTISLYSFELPSFNLSFEDTQTKKQKIAIEKYCNFPNIPKTKNIKSDKFKIFQIEMKKFNICVDKYFNTQFNIYKTSNNIKKKNIIINNIKISKKIISEFNENINQFYKETIYINKKKHIYLNDKNRLKNGKSRKITPNYY
jgi:hypothetical protein